MTTPAETFLKISREIHKKVTALRRHFHMYPELSFNESNTADFICSFLEENGIPFRRGIAGNGIIGEIRGNGEGGRVIALRAEMDALPVYEQNKTEWSSRNEGIMHACGHDAHMAMLLGAALLLARLKNELPGTIMLIFQPGEEVAPGGARLMIESGAFDNIKPDIVLAQHVLPELESGKAGYRSGEYMASSDEIYLTIRGKGGHAALPGHSTDQIYIASKLIIALKDSVNSIAANKNIPTVLGIGRIRGDGATNVIPDKVEIAGTFRTFSEEWRREAKELMKSTAYAVAKEYGIETEIKFVEGYPVLVNDEALAAKAVELSSVLLGRENTEMLGLRMSSDDFAFFTGIYPSLYFRTGIRRKDSEIRMLHTAGFDIDEEAMVTGVANMSWLAYNFLREDVK